MLRASKSRLAALGRRHCAPVLVFSRGAAIGGPEVEQHIQVTEQEQGHLLERLQDPEEVFRMSKLQRQHKQAVWGVSTETMADTIMRESLEAAQADLDSRMRNHRKKAVCEHGHEHDVCCGGKDEMQGSK